MKQATIMRPLILFNKVLEKRLKVIIHNKIFITHVSYYLTIFKSIKCSVTKISKIVFWIRFPISSHLPSKSKIDHYYNLLLI
jgi:hypothetical protein